MAPCSKPKCHRTIKGCRCPNAWLEHLAHSARQSGERKSMKQHVAAYRKLKHKGYFLPKHQSACRSDVDRLCQWNQERSSDARRTQKQTIKLPKVAQEWRTELEDVGTIDAVVQENPVAFILGYKEGIVLKGELYDDEHDNSEEVRTFLRAVGMQMVMHRKLGDATPNVHAFRAWKKDGKTLLVAIMDRALGTVEDILRGKPTGKVLKALAEALTSLYTKLRQHRLVHGDLNLSNITFRLAGDGKSLRDLGVIDCEDSQEDVDSEFDMLHLWGECIGYYPFLEPFLHRAGFPAPKDFPSPKFSTSDRVEILDDGLKDASSLELVRNPGKITLASLF